MDLTAPYLRDCLQRVDVDGWDSAAGRQLLDHMRRAVVIPVVRRSGLRGPAAEQAMATGWEAAWDALRRPTARTAENPGGMVWVAVRRAVATEVEFARMSFGGSASGPVVEPADRRADGPADRRADRRADSPVIEPVGRAHLTGRVDQVVSSSLTSSPWVLDPRPRPCAVPERRIRCLSLDDLLEGGWHPADTGQDSSDDLGSGVSAVLDGLVDAGWDRAVITDAVAIMADHAAPTRSGAPSTRWRWVSLRIGIPEWQARRLAGLLLGGRGWAGVLELVVVHGAGVIEDPAVRGALRSTTSRWSAGPGEWLATWEMADTQREDARGMRAS
jgi:hypothetical protein